MGKDHIDVCVLGKYNYLPDEIISDFDSEQPSAGTQANEFVFLIYLNLELADQFLRIPSDHAIVNVDSQDDCYDLSPSHLIDYGLLFHFRIVTRLCALSTTSSPCHRFPLS